MKSNIAGELGTIVDTIRDEKVAKGLEKALADIDERLEDKCDLPAALIYIAEASQYIEVVTEDGDESLQELKEKFFLSAAQAILDRCRLTEEES